MMKEYLKLLARRESKVVLGGKWANLWLLTIVLVATFVSIAFSNGSMKYLSEKMNDPFTNWVNIENQFEGDKLNDLQESLTFDDALKERYHYKSVQGDGYFAIQLLYKSGNEFATFEGRSFEHLDTELVREILKSKNIVGGASVHADSIPERSLGLIITKEMLHRLGYSEDSIPEFIYYMALSEGADSLGFDMVYDNIYAAAPIPLLAVVNRLPMNMDIISSQYFHEQYQNGITFPFCLNNREYAESLLYFVPSDIKDFAKGVKQLDSKKIRSVLPFQQDDIEFLRPWKQGSFMKVYLRGKKHSLQDIHDINELITSNYNVTRVHKYNVSDDAAPILRYLSVHFNDLDSIRAFENFANTKFNVNVEMSQVSSKENFNAVSVMANILSWAMIVFSIVCIIMFIVNMLQSYFQKVKRNLGTFKAFGISSSELIMVYVIILLAIVICSIVISLAFTWIIQLMLPVFNLMKDGTYNYLSLWNMKTVYCIAIVIVATIVTVRSVMRKLLKQTPGDLIYDR